jgi:RES domain-containing protein
MPEDMFPTTYQLLKLEIPDSVSRERLDLAALPKNWIEDAVATRSPGDLWLRSHRSALLEVPSAILPETSNWLLNPDHPDARQIHIEWIRRFPYDSRLFQKRKR